MEQMQNRTFTIAAAFNTCFYIVPDYQREYIWKEKQVSQLLEDIDGQIDEHPSEYFIGTVLVAPTTDKDHTNDQNHFDVIDGQQRLTTIFITLCALRILFLNKGMKQQDEAIKRLTKDNYTDSQGDIKTSLRLEPRYENADTVIQMIVETDGPPQVVRADIQNADIPVYGSVEKILAAYDKIYDILKEKYDSKDKLKKYLAHLTNKVLFIQISTKDIGSALKIFETINERGIGLDSMDLLKNLLFTEVASKEFSQLKGKWKKITKELEKNKEKPLRFLRYFLMANYVIKNERNDAIIREDQIYDWFSNSDTLTEYKTKPFEFVEHAILNVKLYTGFRNGRGNDREPSFIMQSLQKLTGKAFSLHYMLLLAAAALPKPLFDHFVSQLESFLFCHIFAKTPTKDLERSFALWTDEVREITHIKKQDEQRDALNRFIAKRFKESMKSKSQELKENLEHPTLRSMQQYRTRYLLARLAQHVDMVVHGKIERGNLDPYFNPSHYKGKENAGKNLEIEHILPNTPKPNLLTSWQKNNPEQSYDEYKNRLGNLILLEKPLNKEATNKCYAEKKLIYTRSLHYLNRSLYELEVGDKNTSITGTNKYLCAFDKWSAEDIKKRQSLLAELAFKIWEIPAVE